MSQDLDYLRSQIRDIDRQILELTSQRMELARQVGEYKARHRLPIKDYKVEKLILERATQLAADLGIYRDLAHTILKTLIEYSVVEQDEIKQLKPTTKGEQAKSFLIIGASGNMGRWFANFFDSLGHSVSIYDHNPSDQTSPGFPSVGGLEAEVLETFDYVFLATPMQASNQILLDFAEGGCSAIIIEISSLKSPIREGLKRAEAANLRTVCIHPMFGPDAEFLAGRNIVFCDRDCNHDALLEVEQLFSVTSANLIHLPFEMHDRLMSYILGASHLINLLYASLMKDSGISLSDLENIAGTTFAKQLEVTKAVISENQDLYFDIQCHNKEAGRLFHDLKLSTKKFQKAIENQSRDDFKALMTQALNYFS